MTTPMETEGGEGERKDRKEDGQPGTKEEQDAEKKMTALETLRANAAQLEAGGGGADVAELLPGAPERAGGPGRAIAQVLRSTAALRRRGWTVRDGAAFVGELAARGGAAAAALGEAAAALGEAAAGAEEVRFPPPRVPR